MSKQLIYAARVVAGSDKGKCLMPDASQHGKWDWVNEKECNVANVKRTHNALRSLESDSSSSESREYIFELLFKIENGALKSR